MFKYKYKVQKNEFNTEYGSVCIENIIFAPSEIERILPDIVLLDENLKHMFAEDDLNDFKKRNIYRRFIPRLDAGTDLEAFITKSISENKTFYSFLAEGILGLIFRDLYGYCLTKGIIDTTETLTDTHTGVDACMYDLEENVIVLGEAKFYESLNGGINKIINDFTNKSIKNKMESLLANTQNCEEACQIVIKNLSEGQYEELTMEQFINQNIIFAGFVLHSENEVSNYNKQDFYDGYNLSVNQLKNNIKTSLKIDNTNANYRILMVHLPISDKKSLIAKMIEASKNRLQNV